MRGEEIKKSAEARLQAMGIFQTTATRKSAFTSGSCESGASGSQKKMRKSMPPSAIRAPICWSPPSGPLSKVVILQSSSFSRILPVVPVAYNSCISNVPRLNLTHSSKSGLLWSWAISAILFFCSIMATLFAKAFVSPRKNNVQGPSPITISTID